MASANARKIATVRAEHLTMSALAPLRREIKETADIVRRARGLLADGRPQEALDALPDGLERYRRAEALDDDLPDDVKGTSRYSDEDERMASLAEALGRIGTRAWAALYPSPDPEDG